MLISQVLKLQAGDEVHWNDPDNGLCSKHITISEITVQGNDASAVVSLIGKDGSHLECFPQELA
jgi:hypothetical protein